MKIIPSPPDWGARIRVRGVYLHGKKSINDLFCDSGPNKVASLKDCWGEVKKITSAPNPKKYLTVAPVFNTMQQV
jgi:hypothetical protein